MSSMMKVAVLVGLRAEVREDWGTGYHPGPKLVEGEERRWSGRLVQP